MSAPLYHKKLARVLDRMGGLYRVEDILAKVAEGKMQSFARNNTWVLTRIMDHPRGRCLEIFAIVGDLDDALILNETIMDYASRIGAKVVQAYGRKGWMDHGRRRGWKVKAKAFVYQREVAQ